MRTSTHAYTHAHTLTRFDFSHNFFEHLEAGEVAMATVDHVTQPADVRISNHHHLH